MPRPLNEIEEWAVGNFAAGAETWSAEPRRDDVALDAFTGSGHTPGEDDPTPAEVENARIERYRKWIQWAVQLAVGLHAGEATDGAHTVVGTETLTTDLHCSTLTVPAGTVLNTAGFVVFARTKILVAATGEIRRNGNPGAASVGGAGGAGGAALANGTVGGSGAGGAGSNGGAGDGAAGTGQNPSVAASGAGGDGGDGDFGTLGGAGGVATTSTAANGGPNIACRLANAIAGRNLAPAILLGGSGGGGGGNGGGGAGGGGGSGGGVMALVSPEIENLGTIEAEGGVGGNAAVQAEPGGGGGGGQGGAILVVTAWRHGAGTWSVAGGAGGTGGGGAAEVGETGDAGRIVYIDAESV
jgi:hypothetical protein